MTQSAQKTLRDYLQETEDAITKGRMDTAESNCQHILAQFPESLEAQRLLGEIYLAKSSWKEAQQAFDWVLTNDPENVIAYCDRALISERQGDYDTSLDCYQQAYELSRGNSKIRQEFNELSKKAGQQGFMLSRAGLARLYMRGDLLTQAIQEWEAVLAVTPDRLDARTGLLETYWREGLYERVEQLAAQILQDVPGCEKALLLLAYVTSLKNTTQAQDLIKRVESLDPDLLMAHDLFSDLFASQPAEPFLNLLKKPPVSLSPDSGKSALPTTLEEIAAGQRPNAPKNGSSSSATWESLQNWQGSAPGITNTVPGVPQEPALPIWPESPGVESSPWADLAASSKPEERPTPAKEEQPVNQTTLSPEKPLDGFSWDNDPLTGTSTESSEAQPEPWEALQDALGKANAEGGGVSSLSPEIWATLDQYLQTSNSGSRDEVQLPDREDMPAPESSLPEPAPAPEPAKESTTSTTPSWITSLNRSEKRNESPTEATLSQEDWQSQIAASFNTTPSEASPAQLDWSASRQQQAEPPAATPSVPPAIDTPKTVPAPQEKIAATPEPEEAADDEEESLFGPNWLRSIGATDLEEEEQAEAQKKEAASVPEASPTEAKASTPPPNPPEEEPSWMSSLQASAQEQQDTPWTSSSPSQPSTQEQQDTPWISALQSSSPQEQQDASWMSSLQPSAQEQQDPSWLDALQQSSSEPSWLSSLQQSGEATWMDALQPEARQEQKPASSEPDWANSAASFGLDENWMKSISEAASPLPPLEQEQPDDPLLTTLKELEEGLMAQGFVQLEPNSLSSIAQEAGQPAAEEPAAPALPPEEPKQQPEATPSLSSALAALGGYSSVPTPENSPAANTPEERRTKEVPAWALALSTVPEPAQPPAETKQNTPAKQEKPVTRTPSEPPAWQRTPAQPAAYNALPTQPAHNTPPAAQPMYTPNYNATAAPAAQSAYNAAPTTQPTYNAAPTAQPTYNAAPTAQPAYKPNAPAQPAAYNATPTVQPAARTGNTGRRPQEPQRENTGAGFRSTPAPAERAPIVQIDPSLDSELETTMKRPAIRIQSTRTNNTARDPKEQPANNAKGQQRISISKGNDQGTTNQERLIAGYQHQLVGGYDEAMQEYRIIIRNSPDLLGEVISNVRALLKLAPKYAAGYRVLGDAYMRQGEYLQAMEAYNKALTIAKKKS